MPEHRSQGNITPQGLPRHLAIIMDGNGRWAKKQGKDRSHGHRQGLETARTIVAECARMGIPWVSLYVFSTENWKRAQAETGFLMDLLCRHLRREYDFYKEKGIRLVHSGDRDGLPPQVLNEIDAAMEETAHFDHLVLNLAINYGSRDELIRAFRRWSCTPGTQDENPQTPVFDTDSLGAFLDVPELPDVDLMIRTGGEKRISNFLLWKSAYAELFFSDTLWPDWSVRELEEALADYRHRQRRFGGTP